MKLQAVVYASVPVGDQDRAIDFYTRVLGLELRADSLTRDGPRFVMVGVPGQDFSFILWPGTPATVEPGTAAYTIEVDDCAEAMAELGSRGVAFDRSGVVEYPWGWVARFSDPDGNRLQVRQGR